MAHADRLLVPLARDPVHLDPLGEEHREPLRAACADDEEFWPLYPRSFGEGHFDRSFDEVMADPGRLAFAAFAGGVLVGMTGYLNVDAANDVVEIGGTYLTKAARGSGTNRRFKDLLIPHAFACGFQRIEFRIDTRNICSQRAVEKLGAVREGVLRRQRRLWNGYVRDTAIYGLLADERRG